MLQGKVALISGAASGIGTAAARAFVEQGACVVLGDVADEKGAALAQALGANARYLHLDVTSRDDWLAAIAVATSEFGRLTTLVNSAGICVARSFEEETLETFRRTLSVNLEGVFLGCRTTLEALKKEKGASIVNVASTLGVKSSPSLAAYSTSKGGMRMLTRALALHCAERGYDIRVNALLPGSTHTEMVDKVAAEAERGGARRQDVIAGFAAKTPMKRLGTPEEQAAAIAFLASDAASFITGTDLAVDGGTLA
jgi:3(or 17)beta-hydroxysteroid dehydrogenase